MGVQSQTRLGAGTGPKCRKVSMTKSIKACLWHGTEICAQIGTAVVVWGCLSERRDLLCVVFNGLLNNDHDRLGT